MSNRRSHSMGSVFQQKDGRWVASVSDRNKSGKRVKVRRYARTQAEARAALREMIREQEDRGTLTSGNDTLANYLTRWLEDSVRSAVRPRTFQGYESMVRVRIIPTIGDLKLKDVTPAALRQLYARLDADGLSPRSIQHTHRLLHKAFKQAMHDRLINWNPTQAVSPPRAASKEMSTLTQDQVNILLAGTEGDRHHALFALAITSGLRLGELLGLRWTDLELEERRLFVRRTLQRTIEGLVFAEPKTAKSRRTVMLGERGIAALKEHRRLQAAERLAAGPLWEDQELVFPNETGRPWDPGYRAHVLRRELARLELPRIRFHDLRHTCATLLLSAGTHPKVVSEMLGHSTVTLTLDVYSHVAPVMHSEAAATMDRVLG